MDKALAGLDDHQRLVATTRRGPICVLAGPGTGKTRALTSRIAHYVSNGAQEPDQILALTFTTKAAQEMMSRLRRLGVGGVEVRTFHSAALSQLSFFWPSLTGGSLPEIVPRKGPIVAKALDNLSINIKPRIVRDLVSEIEWRKSRDLTVEEYSSIRSISASRPVGRLSMDSLVGIHEEYEKLKDQSKQIDFEDVLLAALGMLRDEGKITEQVHSRYSTFLVDEYQDVSPVQQSLLEAWIGDRDDLAVVGDVGQTIFSFAGATNEYLLNFPKRYPGAEVIKLENNYRSGTEIVALANRVLAGSPGAVSLRASEDRFDQVHRYIAMDDHHEAAFVAGKIREIFKREDEDGSVAILVRSALQLPAIETALRDAGIDFDVQDSRAFFDQPLIKRALMEIRGAAVAGVEGKLSIVVSDILIGLGLPPNLSDVDLAKQSSQNGLAAIKQLADGLNESTTLKEFSELLVVQAKIGEAPTEASVSISTIHSAKGREWSTVFAVGMNEGIFPSSHSLSGESLEEERRLFYVAVTRAKRELYLTGSERDSRGNARKPSRFLDNDI